MFDKYSMSAFLEIENLSFRYGNERDGSFALKNVSLSVSKGETLGIIGESGSGKSTLAKAIVRLIAPTSGSIFFEGFDLCRMPAKQLKPYRRKIQLLFQNFDGALNPRMKVRDILSEPVEIHRHIPFEQREGHFKHLLSLVQLPLSSLEKYPHEFSGGQRQRINIARALAASPDLLICDEPFSALDASTQEQMIHLFLDLKNHLGISMVMIGHDLPLVAHLSDRIGVMLQGCVVEQGGAKDLCKRPVHPYTQSLLRNCKFMAHM